jgi:GT2 family glycosyltransferase
VISGRAAVGETSDVSTTRDFGQGPGPRVYVVIPVHNRLGFTRKCLGALKLSTWATIDILVVDDGSTDGTREALLAEYPEVAVLPGDGQLWWTGAMATAIGTLKARFQPGEFVMSVNNDTQVEPSSVSRLIEVSRAHGRGMVAAAARTEDGCYVAVGARLPFDRTLGSSLGLCQGEGTGELSVVEADTVFGRATLIPVEAFDMVGNYRAKEFPQYWGDSDFSLRARRAGIRQVVTFSTIVRCAEDAHTTGLHYIPQRIVSLGQAVRMLLSRRSNLCLLYAARFMWLHAPEGRRLASVARQCSRNCRIVLRKTLPGLVLHSVVTALRHTRTLPDQPLTYPEMRKLGFDPAALVQEQVVVAGRVRHAYWIVGSFMKMWRTHPEYRRLMLHSRNPVNWLRKARWFRRAKRRERRRCGRGGQNV